MKVTIKDFMFNGPALDQETVPVPADTEIIKEWLDDYKIPYGDRLDVYSVYIRTWLFNNYDVSWTLVSAEPSTFEKTEYERYCVDIVDQDYKEYMDVDVQLEYETEMTFDIDDLEIAAYSCNFPDDDAIEMTIYEWLMNHLKVTIRFL